jgi:hypothetical protein
MPEPISCSNANQSTSSDFDPHLDDVGKVSRAEVPNSSRVEPEALSSPAVPLLVSAVPPRASVLPPPTTGAAEIAVNNNAQRTSDRSGIAPYAAAAKTAAGDSVFVGAALLKGRDAKTGLQAEVLSVSAQVGAQNEFQIGLVRVAGGIGPLTGSVENMTARANAGIHNDDGSTGFNLGAGAIVIGGEATLGTATSGTFGLAVSMGEGASLGFRDIDGDGAPELCGRVSSGAVTLGLCLESPL